MSYVCVSMPVSRHVITLPPSPSPPRFFTYIFSITVQLPSPHNAMTKMLIIIVRTALRSGKLKETIVCSLEKSYSCLLLFLCLVLVCLFLFIFLFMPAFLSLSSLYFYTLKKVTLRSRSENNVLPMWLRLHRCDSSCRGTSTSRTRCVPRSWAAVTTEVYNVVQDLFCLTATLNVWRAPFCHRKLVPGPCLPPPRAHWLMLFVFKVKFTPGAEDSVYGTRF